LWLSLPFSLRGFAVSRETVASLYTENSRVAAKSAKNVRQV